MKDGDLCMENIKLLHGDCLELMKDIPDKSIDLVLCDLPYALTWAKWDNEIPMNDQIKIQNGKKIKYLTYEEYKWYCISNLKIQDEKSIKKMWNINKINGIWTYYNRIIKDDGAIVLFSTQPFTTKLINSNIKNYKYSWYWVKNIKGNYLNAKRQPLRQLEEINVFNKHKYYPQGIKQVNKIGRSGSGAKTTLCNYSNKWFQENEGYPSNILYYDLDKDKFHPTQKPVALLEYLIKTYTNEGDLVLDNCMGSGSTGVAAINTNRKFIGIEKDDNYFEIARNRIEQHLNK